MNELLFGSAKQRDSFRERGRETGWCAGGRYDRAARGGPQDKHKWFAAGVWGGAGGHERGVREKERRVWWPWCGGEGWCVRGKGLGGEVVAAMTTDGGGSKQMSASWRTGAERARVTEGQVDIQEHSGAAESL